MAAATTVQLSRDDIVALLEEQARARVGRSARDVLREYRAGRLENPGDVADLLVLADLLPADDPLFNSA